MSLKRRGDIWHYDFTVDDERFRGTTGMRLRSDALKVEDQARREAKLGGSARRPVTFGEAADLWFASRAADRKDAKKTALRVRIAVRLIGAGTRVDRIGAAEVEAAMQARRLERIHPTKKVKVARPPSNATVNRDLIDATTRPILRYAAETLELPVKAIPWARLRLAEPKPKARAFTADELARWRAGLPAWHRPLFDFYARYGLRMSELFFDIDAYDPDARTVTVRERKNDKPHIIRLLDEDAAALAARIGRARAAGLRVPWFKEMKSGELRPIKPRGFESASDLALDRAGIQARPVHDLRHHAAMTLQRKTGNLAAVKGLLGHESIQSTMRYAHADVDDVFDALRHTYDTVETAPGKKTG